MYKEGKAKSLGQAGVGVGSGGASTMERALNRKRPAWHWRLEYGQDFHLPYTSLQLYGLGSTRRVIGHEPSLGVCPATHGAS